MYGTVVKWLLVLRLLAIKRKLATLYLKTLIIALYSWGLFSAKCCSFELEVGEWGNTTWSRRIILEDILKTSSFWPFWLAPLKTDLDRLWKSRKHAFRQKTKIDKWLFWHHSKRSRVRTKIQKDREYVLNLKNYIEVTWPSGETA